MVAASQRNGSNPRSQPGTSSAARRVMPTPTSETALTMAVKIQPAIR